VNAWGWLVLTVGLVLVWRLTKNEHEACRAVMAAFAVRAGMALTHFYITPMPDSQSDAIKFERLGWLLAENGLNEKFQAGSHLYVWFIAVVYSVTGRSPLVIQSINVLFGTLIVWNVYRLSLLFWDKKTAVKAAWITAFFPTMMLFSAINRREVAVVYPFVLGMLYFVHWYRSDKLKHLLGAFLFLALATLFHSGFIIAVAAAGAVVVVRPVYLLWRGVGNSKKQIVSVLCMAVIAVALIVTGWGLDRFERGIRLSPVLMVQAQQEKASRGRAGYFKDFIVEKPADFIWHTPARMLAFMFAPIGWRPYSAMDVYGWFDGLFYLALFVFLYRSRRILWRNTAARAVLGIFVCLLFIFAIGTSNYGSAIRHRAKLAPVLIGLAAVVYSREKEPEEWLQNEAK
jgi:4-amino-4-deoxy-L-arabinose transferase-like glycosyltransferase